MITNPHEKNLIPLLPQLVNLNQTSANDLLQTICKTNMSTDLRLFWKLANILNNPEKSDQFDKWLHDSIRNRIPSDCDPFIFSMFSHNKEKVIESSKDISPSLPLIFASPPSGNAELKDVPSFLQHRDFKYGTKTISGSCVWNILMGDITGLITSDLGLDWSLLFALHFWNSKADQTDYIRPIFLSFCEKLSRSAYDFPKSPIFLLFQFHSEEFLPEDAKTCLADIASLLPPIDMYFFLKIYQGLDFRVSETSISLALDILKYTLISKGFLPELIDLLTKEESFPNNGIKEICESCVTPKHDKNQGFSSSSKFSSIENTIIQKCPDVLSPSDILSIKAEQSQILQEQFKDEQSLEYARLATNFFIEASGVNDSNAIRDDQINGDYFELANYQAFKVYLPKAMELGEELSKGPIYHWSSIFAQNPELCQAEDMQTFSIIEALKKVDQGDEISQFDLETIGDDILGNKDLPSRFKLYVVSKLCESKNGYQIFAQSQATPKDKLLEHYQTAFK